MSKLFTCLLLILSFGAKAQDFQSLIQAISHLENGDTLVMEYQMNGCFNPYQKGILHIAQTADTIHATISSSNDRSDDTLRQTRTMAKHNFLTFIEAEHEIDAENIFGSTIVYTLSKNGVAMASEAASIQKRHLIESFYPFQRFMIIESTKEAPKFAF